MPIDRNRGKYPYGEKLLCPAVEGSLLLDSFITTAKSKVSNVFRFFDSPVELRNIIYEMVFVYPKSGLHVFNNGRNKSTISDTSKLYSHSHKVPLNLGAWESHKQHHQMFAYEDELHTRPLKKILAPLTTCQQFCNEAMSTFFWINHFYLEDLEDLYAFLRKVGPRSRKHLAQVSITVSGHESPTALRGLRLLSEVDHLKRLNLRFNESRWIDGDTPPYMSRRMESHDDLNSLAALPELRLIKGLEEVNFCGPCPRLEKELRESMCSPKPTKPGVERVLKKRKAKDGSSANTKGRKSKKAKAA